MEQLAAALHTAPRRSSSRTRPSGLPCRCSMQRSTRTTGGVRTAWPRRTDARSLGRPTASAVWARACRCRGSPRRAGGRGCALGRGSGRSRPPPRGGPGARTSASPGPRTGAGARAPRSRPGTRARTGRPPGRAASSPARSSRATCPPSPPRAHGRSPTGLWTGRQPSRKGRLAKHGLGCPSRRTSQTRPRPSQGYRKRQKRKGRRARSGRRTRRARMTARESWRIQARTAKMGLRGKGGRRRAEVQKGRTKTEGRAKARKKVRPAYRSQPPRGLPRLPADRTKLVRLDRRLQRHSWMCSARARSWATRSIALTTGRSRQQVSAHRCPPLPLQNRSCGTTPQQQDCSCSARSVVQQLTPTPGPRRACPGSGRFLTSTLQLWSHLLSSRRIPQATPT
mmetsp:Transcript_26094/g.75330  ORF Transcript_26094/g.75330 Transcript_26094/m.75330 type:complete len:396 (+) Transcript_26094:2382-3569(+)